MRDQRQSVAFDVNRVHPYKPIKATKVAMERMLKKMNNGLRSLEIKANSKQPVRQRSKRDAANLQEKKTQTDNAKEIDSCITENNEYLKKVQQKRKLNEQRLNELGLVDMVQGMKKRKLNQPKIISGRKKAVQPTRRSSRKANKPALYSGEEIDSLREHIIRKKNFGGNHKNSVNGVGHNHDKQNLKIITPKRPYQKSHRIDIDDAMTPTQRESFVRVNQVEWVNDMEQYFLHNVGNSSTNVERVLRVVNKLVNGEGVKHPMTNEYFKRNVKIHLDHNFHALLEEASEWVYNNGGDRGHGWLVEHPVKKCLIYQHARFKHGSSFHTEVKP